MQQHSKVAFRARQYNPSEWEPVPCDLCMSSASDVHHIFNSYRWKRDNDVYNLAVLCIGCHNKQHSKRTDEESKQLQVKVKRILNNLDEWHDKCREYWFYF